MMKSPQRTWVPSCTHVSMERVYYPNLPCPVCQRVPPMGFLYECREDMDFPLWPGSVLADSDSSDSPDKTPLRRELEEAGLSESVILTAEQGGYTSAQLLKLKSLKDAMRQTIIGAIQAQQTAIAGALISDGASTGPVSVVKKTRAQLKVKGAFGKKRLTRGVQAVPSCSFRACHTCRPYFKERIYIALDAVLANEFRLLTGLDAAMLPTMSAAVMRQMDFAKPTRPSAGMGAAFCAASIPRSSMPSDDSTATYMSTESDMDNLDENRRRLRQFYKMGRRSSGSIQRDLARLPLWTRRGLMAAFKAIFRPTRESSSSGSNITLPLPRTSLARPEDDVVPMGEFDIYALRRVRRHKERFDSRSLVYDAVNGVDVDGDEGSSNTSVYSASSTGSEVEVAGGVALTEEAVETLTPDILTGETDTAEPLGDLVDLSTILRQV